MIMNLDFSKSYFFRKRIKFIIGALLIANVLAWWAVFEAVKPKFLEVNFFDVGQGDAIFIETPSHHQILIDGGPDKKVLEKLAKNMPFWDRTLDLVILTHPQKDHIAGLVEVLRRYKVQNILWTGATAESQTFEKWKERLNMERGAKIVIAKAGQKIKAGKLWLKILHPEGNLENKKIPELNDASVVMRADFNETNFLFTGDIPSKVELNLVKGGKELKADVLKIAHHGSKYSSHPDFLQEVAPDTAVISSGQNNYGHPAPEVLERLESLNIRVLRTDKQGDIKMISDGEKILWVNSK